MFLSHLLRCRIAATAMILLFTAPHLKGEDSPKLTLEDGPKPNQLLVSLPPTWDKTKTSGDAKVYELVNGVRKDDVTQGDQNPGGPFRVEWSGGSPGKETKILLTLILKNLPGEFSVVVKASDGKELTQSFVNRAEPGKPKKLTASDSAATVAAGSSAGINVASPKSAASAAKDVGQQPGAISKLAIEIASQWQASDPDTRRNYIKRLDSHPVTSCRAIAKIFRDTADLLDTSMTPADAEKRMHESFAKFYAETESKYYFTNPRKDDWSPYLGRLNEVIHEEYGAVRLADPQFAKYVVLELADAFDRIAAYWADPEIGRGDDGAHEGGGLSGASSYQGGAPHSCPRCRRRCRCARLLLGF